MNARAAASSESPERKGTLSVKNSCHQTDKQYTTQCYVDVMYFKRQRPAVVANTARCVCVYNRDFWRRHAGEK